MPLLIKIRITRSNRGNVLGNFPYFHIKHIVDGTRKNCLSKAILMSTNNIYFYGQFNHPSTSCYLELYNADSISISFGITGPIVISLKVEFCS